MKKENEIKSRGAVKHKLKQASYRHRKKYIEGKLKRLPCNCVHNVTFESENGKSFSFCGLSKPEWGPFACDTETPEGLRRAATCPEFEAKTPEELKKDFNLIFNEVGLLALKYPDLAALRWVLGEDMAPPPEEEEGASQPPEDKEDDPPSPPSVEEKAETILEPTEEAPSVGVYDEPVEEISYPVSEGSGGIASGGREASRASVALARASKGRFRGVKSLFGRFVKFLSKILPKRKNGRSEKKTNKRNLSERIFSVG